jgi:hypothetical protein
MNKMHTFKTSRDGAEPEAAKAAANLTQAPNMTSATMKRKRRRTTAAAAVADFCKLRPNQSEPDDKNEQKKRET